MAISIHYSNHKTADAGIHIQKHVTRDKNTPADELKEIIGDTNSSINPELTKYNYTFQRSDYNNLTDNINEWQEARVKAGLKRKDKRTNTFSIATLQLSDDALYNDGWLFDKDGNKLDITFQSKDTIDKVKKSYFTAFNSIKSQPDIYGKVNQAELHFDESTPHVDMIMNMVDPNQPERTVRDLTVGKGKGGYKSKLKGMQDNIMTGFINKQLAHGKSQDYVAKVLDHYGLTRGVPESDRPKLTKNVRKEAEKNKKTEKALKTNAVNMIATVEPRHVVAQKDLKATEKPEPVNTKTGRQQHLRQPLPRLTAYLQQAIKRLKEKVDQIQVVQNNTYYEAQHAVDTLTEQFFDKVNKDPVMYNQLKTRNINKVVNITDNMQAKLDAKYPSVRKQPNYNRERIKQRVKQRDEPDFW